MKPLFFFFLSLLLAAIPNAGAAQTNHLANRNLIFTQGTARVTGQNDSAGILVSIQSEARQMKKAATDNADRTKAVLQAIESLDIEGLKAKTTSYRVTPKKDFKVRPPVTKGYEVYNEIQITTEGFAPKKLSEQVSKVIDTALANGANGVRNIRFYIADDQALQNKGLKLATREALDQARVLAKAAGVKLGRIVSISTQPIAAPLRQEMLRATGIAAKEASMAPPIEPGESKIQISVSVVYEME